MLAEVSSEGEGVCIVCRRAINRRATKCSDCGSFQDWSRHIFRWSGSHRGDRAAAAVGGGALPLEDPWPGQAKIEATVLSCDREAITIAIANTGERTTVVQSADFEVVRVPAAPGVYRDERVLVPKDFKPIKAGDTVIETYSRASTGSVLPGRAESTSCRYQVTLTAASSEGNTSGHPSRTVATCPCPESK